MGLSQDAPERSACDLTVLWDGRGDETSRHSFCKLHVTVGLACFVKPSVQELSPDLTIR